MYNEVMENTDFVIEHIDKEVKVITDRPSSVVNYPANTDFFIENIDDNVISIAHSLNIEASEVEFRPANTDFFIENIDNNVIMIAESLELEPSEVEFRPANTDFFVENIDKNLIAIAEYYDLDPSRVVLRPANTDMFIENIDRNVTLIKSRTNVITKSGSFINVDVPDGGTMQLTAINGNATQNGTPTPDAPVSIETVTGEQTVEVVGKNLLSLVPYRTGSDWYNLSAGAQVVPATSTNINLVPITNGVQATISSGWQGAWYICKVAEGQTYTCKYTQSGANARTTTYTLDENHTVVRKISPIASDNYTFQYSVTMAEGEKYFALTFGASSTGSVVELTEPQLELGSTATAYEPYKGQEYVIPFGDTYLAKIGNYADETVKVGDTWYIRRAIGKVVLDGTETGWGYNSTRAVFWAFNSSLFPDSGFTTSTLGYWPKLCDNFTYYAQSGNDNTLPDGLYENTYETSQSQCLFHYSAITSLADWKTWLSTHPTTVYYALATPTDTEITDESLIEQLNFIADMYEGINNISFIGTGAQGTIEVVINKN